MNDLTTYEKLRPSIITGSLLEWHGNSLISRAIRLRTGEDVNHSSLVITLESPYCGHRVLLFEALSDGIDITFASQRLGVAAGQAYYYPIKEGIDPAPIEQRAFAYVGVHYDFISILEQLAGHVHIEAGRFFCSEFVQYCLGAKVGDDAYVPGELPRKFDKWTSRIQLI